MQIHELPSGTPVDSDLIPFDTGSVNYKTPFSGFDVGENTATFTSGDDDDPQQFKTVDLIETGPLKTVLNRLSMAASNIRYLGKLIGNSIMGTSATTITGAISELKTSIGSFKCVSEGLTYIQGETVLEKVQRAYAQEWMPKGIPFIAQITSGSYYIMIGYWYPNSNYGFCYVQNFEDAHFVRLSDNSGTAVWKITSNYSMASSSSVSIKIGSGSSYTGTIVRSGKLRVYNFYYEVSSAVGTITLTDPIGTVGDDDKPRNEETAAIVGLTNSSWASTDTYPMAIMIDATGKIYMRGKPSEIALCKAFRGQLVWIVA